MKGSSLAVTTIFSPALLTRESNLTRTSRTYTIDRNSDDTGGATLSNPIATDFLHGVFFPPKTHHSNSPYNSTPNFFYTTSAVLTDTFQTQAASLVPKCSPTGNDECHSDSDKRSASTGAHAASNRGTSSPNPDHQQVSYEQGSAKIAGHSATTVATPTPSHFDDRSKSSPSNGGTAHTHGPTTVDVSRTQSTTLHPTTSLSCGVAASSRRHFDDSA